MTDTDDEWRPSCYDCDREMARRNLQPTPVHIHHDDEPGYDRVNVPMCHACRLEMFPTHECEYCGEEYLDISDAVECCQHRRGRPMPDGGIEARPVEDLPDIPECKITATADPAGLIRFEMGRERAEAVQQQVQKRLANAPADPDGLLDFIIYLDYPAYASLTKGLAQLHGADEIMSKQVRIEPIPDPDIAVSVAVNESQIESSMKKNYAALQQANPNQMFGHRFGVSRNGLVLLDQQLTAAFDGAENPIDAVDADDDRFPEEAM